MPQLYIVSVVMGLFVGGALAAEDLAKRAGFFGFLSGFRVKSSQLLIGGLAFVVGALKLFVLSPTETMFFAGDLLPGLSGVLFGGALFIEAFFRDKAGAPPFASAVGNLIKLYGTAAGYLSILIGVLHMLFPSVMFL
jgi:hypothetical protein